MKLIKKSGIIVPRKDNDFFCENVKKALTRRSKDYRTSVYTTQKFYLETPTHLLIPRFFPVGDYSSDVVVDDKSLVGKKINIQSNISPRTDLQTRAMKYMIKNDSGILQLDPGAGKTVITIYAIAQRKRKSLILVHRDSLVDQWRDRFQEFTNLGQDDVRRLTSSDYDEVLKSPIIISTNQTFLSLLNRDRKNFLTALRDANIGIFVGDEVHTTVGAPTFSECSIHVPARVVFGLSATPYRWDGNADIIEHHLGEIYSDDDDTGTMDARVMVMMMDYGIVQKSQFYVYWGGEFQRSRYLNLLKKSNSCVSSLKGLMTSLMERDMIVVMERIKFIEMMHKWSKSESKSMFSGSAKNDQLEYKTVFATPGKIRDGVDIPKKDCLIMTSPISNIEQMAGRICRPHPDKKQPLVIDMVDYGCREICATLFKRLDFYDRKGWNVKGMFIDSTGNKKQMDIYELKNTIKDKWS